MGINSKFIGDTKGNSNLRPCLSEGSMGGSGESHGAAPSSKFIGSTKGNANLKPDRTSGVGEGKAGTYIAGRNKPYTN